ncbi:MAG: hypothetical protein NT062_28050, partial [Proteobacteria bacterium]|nr:hypothetical protein [Pseudomonadota bacterium]
PAGVTINHSLAIDTAPSGTSNLAGDPKFLAPGSYKIQLGSAAIDQADPASLVTIDFFGDLRPQGTTTPKLSDIGADEL